MSYSSLPLHAESSASVPAPIERVFGYLDDPHALSGHMEKSSMMMMGSRMMLETDGGGGRAVGSRIRMRGRMLGLPLFIEEEIVERRSPAGKTWQTIGSPRLLVISQYRMGFALAPAGDTSVVKVFIDYALPDQAPARWLGRLLAGIYARWCTKRMAQDAAGHFAQAGRLG